MVSPLLFVQRDEAQPTQDCVGEAHIPPARPDPAGYGRSYPLADEPVEVTEWSFGIPAPYRFEIAMPPRKEPIETADHVPDPLVPGQPSRGNLASLDTPLCLQPRGALADRLAKALHRLLAHLLRDLARLRVAKVMETQKFEALRHRHDAGLLRVQRKSQFAFEELSGEKKSLRRLAFTSCEENKVIGI